MLSILFFECSAGGILSICTGASSQNAQAYTESIFSLLPPPIKNIILMYIYDGELRERVRRNKDYYVERQLTSKQQHLSERFFLPKTVSYGYQNKKERGFFPKIESLALVGWAKPYDVKIIKHKESDPSIYLDYYESSNKYGSLFGANYGTKKEKINLEELIKTFSCTMKQLQAITISRDKNSLFIVSDTKKEEHQEYTTLYIAHRGNNKESSVWSIKQMVHVPVPSDRYTGIMYFEEFENIGLLHSDEKTVTEIPLLDKPVDMNNQDLLAKFLHKKGVCKDPFGKKE
ncbi:MAG: hypothetical protein AB7E68_00520 [Candidatus Babeliales bacterium]